MLDNQELPFSEILLFLSKMIIPTFDILNQSKGKTKICYWSAKSENFQIGEIYRCWSVNQTCVLLTELWL